jgi:acetoacetyl-CoA synthetase
MSPLVLLKDGPKRPPLFITHGLGGSVSELSGLAEHLGSARPIYGLQWRGLHGIEQPHDSFGGMANDFADAIAGVWPEGPCLLAGSSIGGLPMLETARILSKQGRQIALLAFLDSYPDPRFWPASCQIEVSILRMRRKLSIISQMPLRAAIPYTSKVASRFAGRVLNRITGVSQAIVFDDVTAGPKLQSLRLAAVRAHAKYRPSFYQGRIYFISARVRTVFPKSPDKIWRALTPDLKIYEAQCHHVAMVEEPALAAAALRLCIEDALKPEWALGQRNLAKTAA